MPFTNMYMSTLLSSNKVDKNRVTHSFTASELVDNYFIFITERHICFILYRYIFIVITFSIGKLERHHFCKEIFLLSLFFNGCLNFACKMNIKSP